VTIVSSGLVSPQDRFVHGQLINLVRRGEATSRPSLEQKTGLGRKVVAQRIQHAIDVGLIDDSTVAMSAEPGRPSRFLRFRADAGVVYAGTIESTQLWAAVATLDGQLVASLHQIWNSDFGPEETLAALKGMFDRLERKSGSSPWAIGIGISGAVEFERGKVIASPMLPGWDGFGVRGWLRENYDAPVWVENDVNLMALGEWHQGYPREDRDLLYVMVDDEVGTALISGGRLLRGHSGAAGNIGHIRVTDDPAALCRCGLTGCLEAVSSGWSLMQRVAARVDDSVVLTALLRKNGTLHPVDIGDAAREGDPVAYSEVAASVRAVGAAAANYINFANPGTVVVGGRVLRLGTWTVDMLESEIRGRLTTIANRDLKIRAASLDHREGLAGAAILAVEQLFGPAAVGLWIDSGSPIGRAAALQGALAG
jgi:predicted NBD/HSP70 family sugar kinase